LQAYVKDALDILDRIAKDAAEDDDEGAVEGDGDGEG
jgi:hypothetical protein